MGLRTIANAFVHHLTSANSWRSLKTYIGIGHSGPQEMICDPNSLEKFIRTRSNYVSQTAFYSYLRARAGTRFPELFENDYLLEEINKAKWQIWLACLSDLTIYMGQLIRQNCPDPGLPVRIMVENALISILEDTGIPEDAGEYFEDERQRVLTRVRNWDWEQEKDNDCIFSQSPAALVKWGQIEHKLKARDEEMVINSVRYRWIEVRRSAQKQLDTESLQVTIRTGATT